MDDQSVGNVFKKSKGEPTAESTTDIAIGTTIDEVTSKC